MSFFYFHSLWAAVSSKKISQPAQKFIIFQLYQYSQSLFGLAILQLNLRHIVEDISLVVFIV